MDLLFIIVAGLLGTTAMSFAMWMINKKGLANADMIRAIGTIFTSYEESFSTGIKIHYIIGVAVAFIYIALISLLQPANLWGYTGVGTMIGLFHGVAFAFLLIVAVAEHHPLEKFRKAGLEVAVAHLAGHVIYGLVVGLVAGLVGVKFIFS